MNRLLIHIKQAGEEVSVPFRILRVFSEKKILYRSFIASGNFGVVHCEECETTFGQFRHIRLSLRSEILISCSNNSPSGSIDFCICGRLRYMPTKSATALLVRDRFRHYGTGNKQKIKYAVGPTGKKTFSLCQFFLTGGSWLTRTATGLTRIHIAKLFEDREPASRVACASFAATPLAKWIRAAGAEMSGKIPDRQRFERLLIHILLTTARIPADPPAERNKNGPGDQDAHRVFQLAENIILSMDEYWSISRLAASAKYSETKLKSMFRKNIGMSATAFRIRVRLEEAKRLLLHSALSVREIAAAVGYANPTHFSRLFKNKTASSPSAFRRSKPKKENTAWPRLG